MPIRNKVEYFNVYTTSYEDLDMKILPVIKRDTTEWKIRIYRESVQGPLWEGFRITPSVIEDYELPEIPQEMIDEIHEAVEWSNTYLKYDTEFNRKSRGTAPLSELTELTVTEALLE